MLHTSRQERDMRLTIAHNLVACLALHVAGETDTTGILLERRVIETLLHGQGTSP